MLSPRLEEKASAFLPQDEAESMEAEASEDCGVVEKSTSELSGKMDEVMEDSSEAEATTCPKSPVKDYKTAAEILDELGTCEGMTEDTVARLEEAARLNAEEMEKREAIYRTQEVCSSNSPQRSAAEKTEETDKLCLSSVTTKSAEECPDSVEGTTELVCEEEEQTQGEQKVSF